MWYDATVRQTLLNPTNYGVRRSHYLRTEERPGGSRRAATLETKHRQVPVSEAEQYIVDPERIEPIPGLTEDLWRRMALRLVDNKAFSSRRAKLSEAERADCGILFGGPARCAVCGGSLSLKRNSRVTHKPWMYICIHLDTVYYGQPLVSMMAHKLDEAVWCMAVTAMRDPAFLAELLAKTDATIGPVVRVESLQQELAEAQTAHARLLSQLERLDADDELVADYQDKLRKNKTLQATLNEALAAAQKAVQAEATRRATLARSATMQHRRLRHLMKRHRSNDDASC